MSERTGKPADCSECGAPVRVGGTCQDNFHELLALEWQVSGGPGEIAHFYAVASYVLQHPDTMKYTEESLSWLRTAVAETLAGRNTIRDLRASAETSGKSQGRVTRKNGDAPSGWGVSSWTTTVADVLAGGVDGYGARVRGWAISTLRDIDAASHAPNTRRSGE